MNLPRMIVSCLNPFGVLLDHSGIPDLQLIRKKVHSLQGASRGAGKNKPSDRTVPSCTAKPRRLCSPP